MESEESAVRSCPLCQLTFPTGYPDDALIKHIDSHLENSKIWTLSVSLRRSTPGDEAQTPGVESVQSACMLGSVGLFQNFPLRRAVTLAAPDSSLLSFHLWDVFFFKSCCWRTCLPHRLLCVEWEKRWKAAFVHKRQSCLERNVKWKQKYRYIYIY